MTANDISRRLERVSSAISSEKSRVDLLRGEMRSTKSQIADEKKRRKDNEDSLGVKQGARDLLSSVLRRTENDIEELFGSIGTEAIGFVFSEDRRLKFKFEPKAGGMGVKLRVMKPSPDGKGEVEIYTSFEGGGVKDVVALALRIAMMELYSPRQDGPIMLDETVKSIADDEAVQGVGEFLKKISEEMGRQIIIITHKSKLASYADRSFMVTLNSDDISKVRVIDGKEDSEQED